MIRQAHTYLVGAMSGTVLIGAAIAVFVVLVSAQVFKDWPVASLGSNGPDKVKVSDSKSASSTTAGTDKGAFATAKANAVAAAAARRAAAAAGRPGAGANADKKRHVASRRPVTSSVANPLEGGESADSPGGSPANPTAPPSAPAPTSSGSGGSNGSGGSGGSGGGSVTQAPATKSAPQTPASSPAKTVTESANGAVKGVDEATGGTVGETGVPQVAEEVVNGVAGPESVVGHAVDEGANAVGGLVGGG